jgi:hypothetical protein
MPQPEIIISDSEYFHDIFPFPRPSQNPFSIGSPSKITYAFLVSHIRTSFEAYCSVIHSNILALLGRVIIIFGAENGTDQIFSPPKENS